MLSSGEAVELRELHRRAYAPGGSLSAADAARLHNLEDKRVAAAMSPEKAQAGDTAAVGGSAGDAVDSGASGDAGPTDDVDRSAGLAVEVTDGADSTDPVGRHGRRGILTRRWFPYAAVGLVLLLGFGIGFVVFGQSIIRSMALSLAVGAEQVRLEAEADFDPGSITALGQAHGATIWHATRDEGENQCLLLTIDERNESACVPNDQFDQLGGGLYASMSLPADDDGDVSGLNVTVVRDVDGRLAVVAQVWSPDEMWDWRSQYSEDELAIIDRIESETGVGGEFLQIVGYDDDRPVWQEFSGPSGCVIVATVGSVERACAEDASAPIVLEVVGPDGTATRYHVTASDTRGPMLTIERVTAAAPDGVIDDTTGEVIE
ncbi:hypothetical protein M2317_002865 [Microbacterium sp. ZKA21]|uniref:hypothetical protein n=1 Tax=Microbacterium sp. ZKA21 TaxID=3381694 RepID=UPI003D1A250E